VRKKHKKRQQKTLTKTAKNPNKDSKKPLTKTAKTKHKIGIFFEKIEHSRSRKKGLPHANSNVIRTYVPGTSGHWNTMDDAPRAPDSFRRSLMR
jgi:hypothetical protein